MVSLQRCHGLSLAVTAGSMAASGSVCAKLAMSADVIHAKCQNLIVSSLCDQTTLYIRVLFFAMIFVCNAVMWTLFTKSLQFCTSSVEATVTNTASNFLCSALFGFLLFNEALSVKWLAGSFMILIGLMLIHRGNIKSENATKERKQE